MLFQAKIGGANVDLVGAGAKGGFWALNRDTGAKVWKTTVGPAACSAACSGGSATDGTRIYVAESNSTGLQRGRWSALDSATGSVL